MSRENAQYWLLPVDENNLRCQAAGYRGLKDYLVSNGLKLCKWKETGLIKELSTPSGTKIQFGRYVQFSKIGTNNMKTLSELPKSQQRVYKLYESETILKPSTRQDTNDVKRFFGNNETQRVKSSRIHRRNGNTDLSCRQERQQNCNAITREGLDSQNNSSRSITNSNKCVLNKQLRLNAPKSRPQSARPCSTNRTSEYPLRRAKTIYVSSMVGLVAAASLSDNDPPKSTKIETLKHILKKKTVDEKQESNKSPLSSTKSLENSQVKTACCNKNRAKKNSHEVIPQIAIKKELNALHGLTEEEETVTIDSKVRDILQIKCNINPCRNEISEPNSEDHNNVFLPLKHKGCSTTSIHLKTKQFKATSIAKSIGCSTTSVPMNSEECITTLIQSTGDTFKHVDEDHDVETIILHRNLYTVSSEEIKEPEMFNDNFLQVVQREKETPLHQFTSPDERKIDDTLVDIYISTRNREISSLQNEENLEDSSFNGIVKRKSKYDIASHGNSKTTISTWLNMNAESRERAFSTTNIKSDNEYLERTSSYESLPASSTSSIISYTSTSSSTYITPPGSESALAAYCLS